jgi:hypothetical protein
LESPAAGDRLLIPSVYREKSAAAPKRLVATSRSKAKRKRPAVLTRAAAGRVARAAGE